MPPSRSRSGALAVAAGIFLSRIFGLVRERALSHYLGNSAAAGAFRAALRIPNLLQNLLGEGVLSASFIPVYARLLAEGRDEEAHRVARAVGTLLALVAAALAALGVLAAPALVDLIAPGYDGATRDLTVDLVRIFFPGTALLVLSAWCLGVLNSHRRFFLSYVSPVVWNLAIIVAAIWGRGSVETIAYGVLVGSGLQLLVQVPGVWRLVGSLRPTLRRDPGVRQTLAAFGPVLLGRGSVQLSAYLDQVLSSFLGARLVSAIAYAQTLYLLPVSLFGMAISAAELPEMASATGSDEERQDKLRQRLAISRRQIVFLVTPSFVAFLTIGPALVAGLFQTGAFHAGDSFVVWLCLAGASLGLLPSTLGRLNASAFYALGDTRTPLRFALVRVGLSAALGAGVVFGLRDRVGLEYAAAALGAASALAASVEYTGLRLALGARIGALPAWGRYRLEVLVCALVAGAPGYLLDRFVLFAQHPVLRAAACAALFGVVYLAACHVIGVPEAARFTRRLAGRRASPGR